ncbi:acetyl-CoA acetyltransferase family protein [Caldalkalibacillus uzonensis]|uniref:acetyl-CoA C-acetyltransferase n=1 Tax=Caldalkalibacillus uzonensis TaxID=353224 RepID=A0ABU0CY91_9BACI|nr:acetyl-CoA C-acetyltransferase [Caldalkalibacillus uzonensis]MDQ0341115.1 acetyl-CoA acetyltransferase family protein [Caldalkalibacillus uzonensis]
MSNTVYIVDGARTPFGQMGGSLRSISATDLGVISAKEAIHRAQVNANDIDNVVYGNVIHSSRNAAYLARHIALKAGIQQSTPALTINRLCGSGLQSVISAAQCIMLGESQLALAGGAENMSMSPFANFKIRFEAQKMGPLQYEDMLLSTLTDEFCGIGMGTTAENLAEKYDITREEQDEYALLSQQRTDQARLNGELQDEIVPVEILNKDGTMSYVIEDEHPKPHTTMEKLAQLKPVFKIGGTVTAGNSSGINDGAASIVLANESYLSKIGKEPLAKIVSWGVAGVDPAYMGIGPVPAIQLALSRAGLSLEDIDLIEVNEAFAAQYLAVERELNLDRNRTNTNGGAIALGHPVGASGTRILLTLAYQLRRRKLKYGVASLCIGGGQGIAIVIENVQV